MSVKRLEADHQIPRLELYVHSRDQYGITTVIISINDIVLYIQILPINRQSRPIITKLYMNHALSFIQR